MVTIRLIIHRKIKNKILKDTEKGKRKNNETCF